MDTVPFPDWCSGEVEWSFYVPSRGPLSIQEEVSFGSMYGVLKGLGPNKNCGSHGDAEVLIGLNAPLEQQQPQTE
jgi:hypothetical protein